MQLICKGQVSLSNEAQAVVVPVPGPRQKRKEPTCAGAVEDETACRQQTMTLTTKQLRALLGAAMVSNVGEELQTRPTRGTSVNVRSNSRRFSPDWLHNAPYSLVGASEHHEQQVVYLQYLHSSNLTARPSGRIAIYRTLFNKSA